MDLANDTRKKEGWYNKILCGLLEINTITIKDSYFLPG